MKIILQLILSTSQFNAHIHSLRHKYNNLHALTKLYAYIYITQKYTNRCATNQTSQTLRCTRLSLVFIKRVLSNSFTNS